MKEVALVSTRTLSTPTHPLSACWASNNEEAAKTVTGWNNWTRLQPVQFEWEDEAQPRSCGSSAGQRGLMIRCACRIVDGLTLLTFFGERCEVVDDGWIVLMNRPNMSASPTAVKVHDYA